MTRDWLFLFLIFEMHNLKHFLYCVISHFSIKLDYNIEQRPESFIPFAVRTLQIVSKVHLF